MTAVFVWRGKGILIDNHYAISIAAFTLAGLCLILDVFVSPKKNAFKKKLVKPTDNIILCADKCLKRYKISTHQN